MNVTNLILGTVIGVTSTLAFYDVPKMAVCAMAAVVFAVVINLGHEEVSK